MDDGLLSGCRIMAITSAFQADDVGSTPITRSSFKCVHLDAVKNEAAVLYGGDRSLKSVLKVLLI